MLYDLHIHTKASDGLLSPTEVIARADDMGLLGLAITDHDTIDGLEEARIFIEEKRLAIDFIAGIEMNTELDGKEIHILGYFIDYHDSHLQRRLEEIKLARLERARKMIMRLSALGFKIDLEQVERITAGALITRPHIAQALLENDYVSSIGEAFAKYIGKGQPAYVNRYKFFPAEAIELIRGAGGIAVLAHPGLIGDDSFIDIVIGMGIEGIEVYYPQHNEGQIMYYSELCRKNKLLITGGSDFHGFNKGENRNELGSTGITRELMQNIFDYQQIKTKNKQKEH